MFVGEQARKQLWSPRYKGPWRSLLSTGRPEKLELPHLDHCKERVSPFFLYQGLAFPGVSLVSARSVLINIRR